MANKDDSRGSLRDRLGARSAGLTQKHMPDGGQVFGGPTASKALSALGARAFTMDKTIFVDDGFDSGNAEDLALYAHESHHKNESGGKDDGHGEYDAEEMAARARERMVMHMAKRGDDAGGILGKLKGGRGPANAEEADAMLEAKTAKAGEANPLDAYNSMLSQGMPHGQIIRELADDIVRTLDQQTEDRSRKRRVSPQNDQSYFLK